MSRLQSKRLHFLVASSVCLLVLFVACSTDSPTAPEQVPSPGPSPGPNTWSINVSVVPSSLTIGAEDPALVTARVQSRDTGASPPNGTTMVLSTSIGEFGESGSGLQTLAVVIDQGKVQAFLFAGGFAGIGTVSAQLEGSVGRGTLSVVPEEVPVNPFILSVSPNTGSVAGGTSVTITGTNFNPPLRVFVGSKLATVRSASESTIRITTPPGDVTIESCDDDDDGVVGQRQTDTPVPISVENSDGTKETLNNAFTYTVANSGLCVGD